MDKKKILVTGSAGFMGSHLVDFLENENHEVFGVDDLSGGFLVNIKNKKSFKQLDLRDTNETDKLIKELKPQIIFHLAAWAHEGLSQFCPIRITENNYNAYLNVLVASVKYNVNKVVCCSSMSVYGHGRKPPFNETDLRQPEDIYAIAKTAMENATEIFHKVYKIDYTIVRPHNLIGPRQNMADPYRNVAAIFINRLLQKKQPYIYGDGFQRRSFSYVDDVIPYLAKCGFLKKTNGEIINIGPIEEVTINELADKLIKIIGYECTPIYMPPRPQEVKYAWCDNRKAKKLLGYETSITLDEGLKRMAEWARAKGPQIPNYLDNLEIEKGDVPKTWLEKLI